jgi:phage terminase large subunit-like protein
VFSVEDEPPYHAGDTPKIFIRPNEHVTFHEYMKHVRARRAGRANIIFVEDVAYQKAAIQGMERALLPVVPMKPTHDKRSRLQVIAPYIRNGTVLFPRGADASSSWRNSLVSAWSRTTIWLTRSSTLSSA